MTSLQFFPRHIIMCVSVFTGYGVRKWWFLSAAFLNYFVVLSLVGVKTSSRAWSNVERLTFPRFALGDAWISSPFKFNNKIFVRLPFTPSIHGRVLLTSCRSVNWTDQVEKPKRLDEPVHRRFSTAWPRARASSGDCDCGRAIPADGPARDAIFVSLLFLGCLIRPSLWSAFFPTIRG